jgi:hypothetical protein
MFLCTLLSNCSLAVEALLSINTSISYVCKIFIWKEFFVKFFFILKFISQIPKSNMHDRKRPFTEKKGDIQIQRSCTASVYDAYTRSDTVGNGFRIRRSYKNGKWLKGKHLCSVYRAIRLPYTVVHACRNYTV